MPTTFSAGLEIVKTASLNGTCPGSDPLAVNIGDTVTYCYNVTNTGGVNLTEVTVNDDTYGSVTLGTTTLAPGERTEGTLTHVVVESDAPSVTDTATATGTDPSGGTVTDTDDCSIDYIITANENPTASFTSNSPQCLCTDIDFDGSASGGTGPYTYDWDFGDGAGTSTAEDPSYQYAAVGTYTVNLTVEDSNNCTNTCYKDVSVYALPSCDITAPAEVCEYSEGNSASTTADYSSYTWSLSAGMITAGQDTTSISWTAPSHTASPVNISVTVIDANGCTNTCYKDVTDVPCLILVVDIDIEPGSCPNPLNPESGEVLPVARSGHRGIQC